VALNTILNINKTKQNKTNKIKQNKQIKQKLLKKERYNVAFLFNQISHKIRNINIILFQINSLFLFFQRSQFYFLFQYLEKVAW
jgi:hypothetical protein